MNFLWIIFVDIKLNFKTDLITDPWCVIDQLIEKNKTFLQKTDEFCFIKLKLFYRQT